MRFQEAVAFVLDREAGYVNDPHDAGGETNMGVSARAYPGLDIRNLTPADAMAIYKRDYWEPCRCDQLPLGVDLMVFDAAVNQGVNAAGKILQLACDFDSTKIDGVIGPATIEAARHKSGLLAEVAARRIFAYGLNPSFTRFGFGWSRRVAQAMVAAIGAQL